MSVKQLFIIINPTSGNQKGMVIRDMINSYFDNTDIDIIEYITTHKGHAFELSRTLPLERTSGICVVGGDGTMHEVINGMISRNDNRRVPIGLIAAGTGNSFLHDLQMLEPIKTMDAILKNQTQQIDLVEVEHDNTVTYGFNVIGWGIPADVNIRAEKMRLFKEQRYNIAAIIEIMINKKRKVSISYDDQTYDGHYGFIVGCNTMYSGKGMKMAPSAKINDGLIDLLVAKQIGRLELLSLFNKVFTGSHLPHKDIHYQQVKAFKIHTDTRQPMIIDGEIKGSSPCSVRIAEEKISVFTNTKIMNK